MAKGKYEKWLRPEGLILLEGWARDGLSDEQIAKNMGIVPSTLYLWKEKYSEISEALKKGKEVSDYIVENALYKSAIGARYEETKIEIMPDGKKKATQIVREVPPNPAAAIFWLKNRKKDRWMDKPIQDNADEYESDGLFEMLNKVAENLGDDDSDMLMGGEEE